MGGPGRLLNPGHCLKASVSRQHRTCYIRQSWGPEVSVLRAPREARCASQLRPTRPPPLSVGRVRGPGVHEERVGNTESRSLLSCWAGMGTSTRWVLPTFPSGTPPSEAAAADPTRPPRLKFSETSRSSVAPGTLGCWWPSGASGHHSAAVAWKRWPRTFLPVGCCRHMADPASPAGGGFHQAQGRFSIADSPLGLHR